APKTPRMSLPIHPGSTSILLVCDLLHPTHNLAVLFFLNRDVRHGRRWRGAVPVLFARREPDNVAWPNLLYRSTITLRPAAARSDNQRLSERMGMPSRPCARLESYAGTLNERRFRRLKQRVNPYGSREPFRGSFARSL